MDAYRGHTLDKSQASALTSLIDYMRALQEAYIDGDDIQDTVDSLVKETEEFLYSLNAINKKVFCTEED